MSLLREIEGFDEHGFAIFVAGQQPDTERCHVYRYMYLQNNGCLYGSL